MNAYASGFVDQRRFIFVTERLLNELAPSEVQAVVAHEIGHLKYRHVARIGIVGLLTSVAAATMLVFATSLIAPDVDGALRGALSAIVGAVVVLTTLATTRRMLRRFEFEADAFASLTMGSPEPMASALRHLAKENWLSQTKLDAGALASHPTIQRRILQLYAQDM